MGCACAHPSVTASDTPGAELERLGRESTSSDFHRRYVLGRKLGAGSYGCVYSARRATGAESVAVKIVDLRAQEDAGSHGVDPVRLGFAAREVAILEALPRSRNIIAFHGAFVGDGLAYLVMERCTSGLSSALSRMPLLTEATLKPLFGDMLSALAACHAVGIVHRDVKCDNFLVDAATSGCIVKLCDFGVACQVSDARADVLEGVFGTPPYMAPEMLSGHAYGAKVDVWAVGVIAYVLLYGRWPYMPPVLSGPAMKDAIRAGVPSPTFCPRSSAGLAAISETCSTWVRALLRRDPARRVGAEQALRLKSFHQDWASDQLLARTLKAAARCGAFELDGHGAASSGDLHEMLMRLNAKSRSIDGATSPALSEVSTSVGVASPGQDS